MVAVDGVQAGHLGLVNQFVFEVHNYLQPFVFKYAILNFMFYN